MFERFADPALVLMARHLDEGPAARELGALRRPLQQAGGVRGGAADAETWFAVATRRIEDWRLIEDAATSALVAVCGERLAEARAERAAGDGLPPATPASPPLAGGLPPQLERALLDQVQTQARRLQAMGDELAAARGALAERKRIERAKGCLIQQAGFGEEEAHRWLQSRAMSSHQRLVDVAEALLAGELPLPPAASG